MAGPLSSDAEVPVDTPTAEVSRLDTGQVETFPARCTRDEEPDPENGVVTQSDHVEDNGRRRRPAWERWP